MKHSKQDKKYISRCVKLAEESLINGDNPFGCVIICGGDILVEAKNKIKVDDVYQSC